ncbi:MAG: penicillin-binding transpeptidase domain-containing protein [Candidatus Coatesbacteria bacterium]
MLLRRRKRESLFEPRRHARRWSPRPLGRLAVVLALALFVGWLAKDRLSFLAALYEGRHAIDRREYPKAQEAFERAWSLKPEHPWVHDCAGYLFLKQAAPGWRAKARNSYTAAIAKGLRSNPFINHVKEARRLLDGGAYDQAEAELEHTLELNPRSAVANLLQGQLLYAQGKLPKAVDQYQLALALAPRSAEIQAALARAQEARSRGNIPYILDRTGQPLAALDLATSSPVYPCDFWTAHVVGYRTTDHGRAGLEEALGDTMQGNVVTLTIDARLQRIVDAALGWQKGAVVIIRPSTGSILAAVSHPTFRPNQLNRKWAQIMGNDNDPLRNRAFDSLYEPGSIAKIVSMAALLESHADTSRLFPFRCRGYLMIGPEPFWDWTAHRTVGSFSDAFNSSCNIAMARMAPLIGAASLTQFLRSFGFGEQDRIALEIPVATSRAPLDADTAYKLAAASCGLGTNFRVTPLHAAMLAAAVANGGVMMTPTLVREIRSVTGALIQDHAPKPWKISMKKETAAALTGHMTNFVSAGLGRKARMLHVKIAGITSTAGTAKRGLNGWFVCFAPADKPELAMAILCENGGTGHGVAAPIAQRILNEALR